MTCASTFEELVAENWSLAVAECSHDFQNRELEVVRGLQSGSEEVRSAAVAILLEAQSAVRKCEVVRLASDPSDSVRAEVLEYLEEFAEPTDAFLILKMALAGDSVFSATSALTKLYPDGPGIANDDEPREELSRILGLWEERIREAESAT